MRQITTHMHNAHCKVWLHDIIIAIELCYTLVITEWYVNGM